MVNGAGDVDQKKILQKSININSIYDPPKAYIACGRGINTG